MKMLVKIVFVVGLVVVSWQVYTYFLMDFSHDGNMAYDLNPIVSPDGTYEANIYFDNYGGAVGGTNLIVKVRDLTSGADAEERTVYFGDGKDSWYVHWLDKDILHVHNEDESEDLSVKLVVDEEVYDQHGSACKLYQVKRMYRCKAMDI